ncbi:dynein regulatory complex subunit 2-like [Bombus pascuorum]|uniref:dynein regulatory complex subunit 2-like n=1 Tax=Bombus pascuorum TaxID=65598 RepID=UPI00298D89BB|nr:dynein regulatory complex subunit 2-like [Bombus pascuorum]
MPDISKKIDITWQILEHAFDFKDYSIGLLLDSLQEAEDQRRKANGAHVEIIDRSLEIHETRLTDADTLFYGNVKTALADKTFQFENINYYRNKKETALRKINLLLNHRGENASTVARSTAISKINTFVEDRENEKRIVTTQLQKRLENLWNDLRNVFSDYRKSTEDRRKGYEIVRKKDQIDQRMISRQNMRIAILLDEIMKFRSKINSYKIESIIELQEMTKESNFFYNAYRETNERFIFGTYKDKHKTMMMSKEYNHSVKYIKDLMIKAERILAYMQMCRKYETQDEKVLPTIDDHPMQLPTIDNNILPLQTTMNDFQYLTNFWRRLNFAQIITKELHTEKCQLLIQANYLRKLMKRYLIDETSPM